MSQERRTSSRSSLAQAIGRWASRTSFTKKWLVLGTLIGFIAGLGAVLFYAALQFATHLFLVDLGHYVVPTPTGEGGAAGSTHFPFAWRIPLIVGLGALGSAFLVFRFAPDAEGHGTDAAIHAIHHAPKSIPIKTVVVKILASALTIGSGGSGGREGPTGQISAGFASWFARFVGLSEEDASIAVSVGVGAGIGSIFSAPLGGALLAVELPFSDDFDPSSLLPGLVASGVGFAIFGGVYGYHPLFGVVAHSSFISGGALVGFALLGIVCALIGAAYQWLFYATIRTTKRIPLPRWVKPVIGGVLVGLIGLAVPQVLGTGYGFIQKSFLNSAAGLPLWILVVVPFLRIIATSLSIGTGGSGGIFGPGMVIGAFAGAAFYHLLHPVFGFLGPYAAPYVVVAMMACFGSVARAPIAVAIMVAEMTGSVGVFFPAVIAVGIASFIIRSMGLTIYESQIPHRTTLAPPVE
jgi:CIC family chloride channel protein